jgi:hypothetical protein
MRRIATPMCIIRPPKYRRSNEWFGHASLLGPRSCPFVAEQESCRPRAQCAPKPKAGYQGALPLNASWLDIVGHDEIRTYAMPCQCCRLSLLSTPYSSPLKWASQKVSARTDSEDNLAFIADLRLGRCPQDTHRPHLSDGRFREDLLYRLNVVPIEVPPLRERVADIPLLVEYFIDRFGKRAGKKFKTIDKKSVKAFQSYGWPGNVRELQNVIERAVILSEGETFALDEGWLRRELRAIPRRTGSLLSALVKQEKEMIETALAASHGQVSGPSGAATKLGLPSRTLDSKIKRLKINVHRFKTAH